MGTIKQKSGPRVIKTFLIKGVDDRIAPFMLFMAFETAFTIHQSVKVLLRVHMPADIFMAIEALIIRNASPDLMALQAVLVLEVLMAQYQRPGRQELVEKPFELL
jgi:hypothetical protein